MGERLANWALANDYGHSITFSGPMLERQEILGDKIVLHFRYAKNGLMVADKAGLAEPRTIPGDKLAYFEVTDLSGKWHPATPVIDGKQVVLSCKDVSSPIAVRYAYAVNPENCNLYNRDGLPASPFCSRPDLLTYRSEAAQIDKQESSNRRNCHTMPAAVVTFLAISSVVLAEVKVPPVFSDHMVLQRDLAAPVWGTAEPCERSWFPLPDSHMKPGLVPMANGVQSSSRPRLESRKYSASRDRTQSDSRNMPGTKTPLSQPVQQEGPSRDVYPELPKDAEGNQFVKYSEWMDHFIRDVRQDLDSPKMPIVIGTMGVEGAAARLPARVRGGAGDSGRSCPPSPCRIQCRLSLFPVRQNLPTQGEAFAKAILEVREEQAKR